MAVRIAIYLFPEAEELDWAGPWDVLAAWAQHWPEDGIEVFTVARDREPVTCAKGLTVVPHRAWDEMGEVDVVVVPGGWGTRALMKNADVLERLRALASAGTLMTSVCTGALVYGAAGLLAGRPATTHHENLDDLRATDASIKVRPHDRFVDDGDVITAAGVSAGIDMALHLVGRIAGPERARAVRRAIQYDPAPPY